MDDQSLRVILKNKNREEEEERCGEVLEGWARDDINEVKLRLYRWERNE